MGGGRFFILCTENHQRPPPIPPVCGWLGWRSPCSCAAMRDLSWLLGWLAIELSLLWLLPFSFWRHACDSAIAYRKNLRSTQPRGRWVRRAMIFCTQYEEPAVPIAPAVSGEKSSRQPEQSRPGNYKPEAFTPETPQLSGTPESGWSKHAPWRARRRCWLRRAGCPTRRQSGWRSSALLRP